MSKGKDNNSEIKVTRIRAILADPFSDYPGLSDREREVLKHGAHGKTMLEIAQEMNLTEKAVGSILYRIRDRVQMSKSELTGHLVKRIRKVLEG